MKYFHARKILFTARDLMQQGIDLPPTFRNRIPQRYYATATKFEIIEKIKKDYRNVLLQTTGVKHSPLFSTFEQHKANNFLESLNFLPSSTRYIHKIILLLSIGKAYYDDLVKFWHDTPGKTLKGLQKLGKAQVHFTYYPNGSIQISVHCSKHPIRLETENDIDTFFSIMGRIYEKLSEQVSDYYDWILPPLDSWILKQCDINNDIPITDTAQVSLPDLQIKTVGRVFRLYVKSIANDAVYRIEESKEANLHLSQFRQFFGGNQNLERKMDTLIKMLDKMNLNFVKGKFETPSVYPSLPIVL